MSNPDNSTQCSPGAVDDRKAAGPALRASVLFALRLYNCQILEGQLQSHISRAIQAHTVGELRSIVAAADQLLSR